MPMGWVAAASALAGLASASAAKDAGGQQSGASKEATASQERMFSTLNAQGAPYRATGGLALAMLGSGFGMPTTGTKPGYDFSGAQVDNELGYWSRPGPNPSADFFVPSGSAENITPEQDQAFNDWWTQNHPADENGNVTAPNRAYIPQFLHDTGQLSAGKGMSLQGGGLPSDFFSKQFTSPDLYLSPNYQFMLTQGLGQTANFMNSRGGLNSGNTLKGLTDYAIGAAGQGYGQAFDIYNTQQTNIFNRLASIAGLGQTANAQSVQAGVGLAPGIASSIQNAGAASAAGTVGQANALAGGLNNAASWYALSNMNRDPGGGGPG